MNTHSTPTLEAIAFTGSLNRLVRRCGRTLQRWATLRCGKCSDRMLGFWCWVLDRLESVFGEPPENAAFDSLVDVWCEMDHDDDEDAPNEPVQPRMAGEKTTPEESTGK